MNRRSLLALLVLASPACQWVVGSYTGGAGPDAGSDGPAGDATSSGDGPPSVGDTGVDTGSEAGPDGGGTETGGDEGGCTPGEQQCDGAEVETCTSAGTWSAPASCATGACSAGACSGSTSGASNPSCTGGGDGLDDCGPATESCCTSQEVPGGTYDRTYESTNGSATDLADPATLSGLRLDKYLVTVGRFRQFVAAWNDGNATPAPGSGKHAHLNGGRGLVNSGVPGGGAYEPGWAASDDDNIAPSDSNLTSCLIDEDGGPVSFSTWTAQPQGQDSLPMNCVNWYEAYAFCIWDGGFLPSEAEWEYAAAAGSQQLEYPWGAADPGESSEYAIYGCNYPPGAGGVCASVASIAPVGSAPAGAGAWGQLDLAGDVFEWTVDEYSAYVDPCVDCAYLSSATARAIRGGAFPYPATSLQAAARDSTTPDSRNGSFGFRCARIP